MFPSSRKDKRTIGFVRNTLLTYNVGMEHKYIVVRVTYTPYGERREDEDAEINWGLHMVLKFGPDLPTLVPFHELRKRMEIEEPERLKKIVSAFKNDVNWNAHLQKIFGELEV